MFGSLIRGKTRFMLTVIFIAAFLMRLSAVCLITGMDGIHSADAARYDQIARNIVEGRGFTYEGKSLVRYTAPVYPFLLAVIYKLFGHKLWIVRFFQICIGSLICLVGYLVAVRLFNKTTGFLTACIMAGHPYLCLLTGYLLTEILFTLFLLLAVLWLVRFDKEFSLRQCLGAGVWLGLATLTRPITLLFPCFIFLWSWLNFRTIRLACRMTLLITFFMLLVLAPWTYRNYRVSGHFVPVITGMGSNLWGGNNSEVFKNTARRGTWYLPESIRIKDRASEVELDRRYAAMASRFIIENPKKFIILLFYKFVRFWQWGYTSTIRNGIITVIYGAFFFPFMVSGLFLSLKYSRQSWILHLLAAFFTTVSLIYFGSEGSSGTRYRVPLEPYLSILAAFGYAALIKKFWPQSKFLKLEE